MDHRLPVASLLAGGVLALPVGLFVALVDGAPVLAASAALVLFLPFAAYAVHVDPDPTALLPPDSVLAVGGVAGLLVVALAALTDALAPGLAAGSLAVAPALVFHGRYADGGREVLVSAGGGALAVLGVVAGLLTGAPLAGGVAGGLLGGATVDSLRARGRLARRTRRVGSAVALLGGVGAVVAGVVVDQAVAGLATALSLLVVGAALAVE